MEKAAPIKHAAISKDFLQFRGSAFAVTELSRPLVIAIGTCVIAQMADDPISMFGGDPGREVNEIDLALGRRVRTYRLQAGLSQAEFADKLGLSFQQVQKYEKGVNRIAASRLIDIASVLNVPLSVFFDFSAETKSSASDLWKIYEVLSTPEGKRLIAAFSAITTPKLRRRVLNLVEAMIESGET